MKINHDNYEALLLDYIEGKLDADTAKALRTFITQHPALGSWEELTADLPELQEENIDFPDKASLILPEIVACQGINEQNFEGYFIAWHENQLDADEKEAVKQFLHLNPSLEAEFRLAGMVYLQADDGIVLDSKEKLIKRAPVVQILLGKAMRVAATIALLFTISLWWFRQNPEIETRVTTFDVKPAKETTTPDAIISAEAISEGYTKSADVTTHQQILAASEVLSAQSAQILQQRYEILPSMTKKESGLVTPRPYGGLAIIDDDLETRLLIAMMLESAQPQQQSPSGKVIRQAIGGFGKTIGTLQRSQELLLPENVLSVGIGFYNMLTDNDVELIKEFESGQLQAVVLQSERLGWRRVLP